MIDAADADDWLHLQRDGFDVWHGEAIRYSEEDLKEIEEVEGVRPQLLSDEEEQQIIDAICHALGV